jgi:tRNA (mo5U34)-methyltransferase
MPTLQRQLAEEVIALGPWCHEIQITPEVSSRVWFESAAEHDPRVPFVNPQEMPLAKYLRSLFATGLAGRSVLDCGCNAGAYTFLARELGAGRCFGFDAREHWIRQARFVALHRDSADMEFEIRELYALPELEPFDVTFFTGLLYHLPDPIRGLKVAADLTRELIFVDTATRTGVPDGFLAIENENAELLLSGIHGLNWLPTGPEVLARMLRWCGFVDCHTIAQVDMEPGVGRLVVAASKVPGFFEHQQAGAERQNS